MIGNGGGIHVDAELPIEGGEHVLIVNGPVLRHFAQAIRRADNLAHPHPAAGQQGARHLRPVVATAARVDPRRASEFTPGHDAHVLVETAGVQVFDQRRDRLIELAKLLGQPLEVRAVTVPTAERERHTAHARLDQPPGHQELIHPVRTGVFAECRARAAAAVAIPHGRIFLLQIERFGQLARRQHVERLLREGVDAAIGRLAYRPAAETRRNCPAAPGDREVDRASRRSAACWPSLRRRAETAHGPGPRNPANRDSNTARAGS